MDTEERLHRLEEAVFKDLLQADLTSLATRMRLSKLEEASRSLYDRIAKLEAHVDTRDER